VKISESYGNEEERKKFHDGIKKAAEEAKEAYTTDTPPSTAYSIWGHDHVGGISSAYAKTVFLEKGRQEWVWSTALPAEKCAPANRGTARPCRPARRPGHEVQRLVDHVGGAVQAHSSRCPSALTVHLRETGRKARTAQLF